MVTPLSVEPALPDLFRVVDPGLLVANDEPLPFQFAGLDGSCPALLICDHAERFLPRRLGDLGLDHADLARHIAWDIGIAEVTRDLSWRLGAPAVLSHFSRLAIDPNRHLRSVSSIPEISDRTEVPGNLNLNHGQRQARVDSLFKPYHAAVTRMIEALVASGRSPALIFMHSFTPVMDGFERPWEIGILSDRDRRLPDPLIARLRAQGINVGDNEPYSGRSQEDYSLHAHGQARGLRSALVEIRQDLIDTHHGAVEWSRKLQDALTPLLEE